MFRNRAIVLLLLSMLLACKSQEDRAVNEGNQIVSEETQPVSEEDRAVSEEDRAVSEEDRAVSEEDRAVSEEDRAVSELEQLATDVEERVFWSMAAVEKDDDAPAPQWIRFHWDLSNVRFSVKRMESPASFVGTITVDRSSRWAWFYTKGEAIEADPQNLGGEWSETTTKTLAAYYTWQDGRWVPKTVEGFPFKDIEPVNTPTAKSWFVPRRQ